MERCFLCHRKMDNKTGLCTNAKCIRSKPLTPKDETEEKKDAEDKTLLTSMSTEIKNA